MFKANNKGNRKALSSLLTLNYFSPFSSFPIVDFELVKTCWENYLRLHSFDTCFNVFTGGKQHLKRSSARNSVIFVISQTQREVTLASH